MAGRALAWVGGLALVLGAIFFLSLAFSRGWIGPELRVLLGLGTGSLCLAGGAAFMERDNRLLGHVLTPVGLAIISISLVGATSLYHLIPVELGLAIALLSAIAAAVIAVRADSQIVAAFGLVAVLIAPPLLGAPADLTTLLFVAVVLIGTTSIALWRTWPWLPPVAFVLSAPQAAAWVLGDPATWLGLVGVGAFWLLNAVAAGGEAFRRRRNDLTPSSATLLLANVAFLIWAGFQILSGDLSVYRGLFLLGVSVAHLAIGWYFVVRDGERNLFGLLAIGTGIAALTMAGPIQLGAPAVPVAWTAEAVALAWIAMRRGHPYSALVSAILYAMAGAALIVLFGSEASSAGTPLLDAHGAALAFFALGVSLGVWIVRDRSLRSALGAFGLTILTICAAVVLDPPLQVIALTILAVIGMALLRVLPRLPSAPVAWQVDGLIPRALRTIEDWRPTTDAILPLVIGVIGILATADLTTGVYGRVAEPASSIAFVDPSGLALVVYLIGLAAATWLSGETRLRAPMAALGLLVTAWACAAVIDDLALVASWSALMVVGFLIAGGLDRRPHQPPISVAERMGITWTSDHALPLAAVVSGSLAALHIVTFELPIDDIGQTTLPATPFTDAGAAAAAILAICVLASGYVVGGAMARRVSLLVAGAVVAYLVPFEVAPWAVSVLWVAIGGLALAIARVDPAGRALFLAAAAIMFGGAAYVAVVIVAPPSRLVVGSVPIEPITVLQTVAALGAVVAGFGMLARAGRGEAWARWVWLIAGLATVYLISVTVVEIIATQVGGTISTDELQTQGQVALSVTWATIGVVAFVAGLQFRNDDLRHGGLALLALATAKVFLFDLSALDVAYRVISLIVLGLLLLASAWLWQRQRPAPPAPPPSEPPTTPDGTPLPARVP